LRGFGVDQYSDGRRIVVELRSASVMIQIMWNKKSTGSGSSAGLQLNLWSCAFVSCFQSSVITNFRYLRGMSVRVGHCRKQQQGYLDKGMILHRSDPFLVVGRCSENRGVCRARLAWARPEKMRYVNAGARNDLLGGVQIEKGTLLI
jgi:hypothetical protein